jgi:hypothetical protein
MNVKVDDVYCLLGCLVNGYKCIEGSYCVLVQERIERDGLFTEKEIVGSSGRIRRLQKYMTYYIPEDHNVDTNRRGNVKSHGLCRHNKAWGIFNS